MNSLRARVALAAVAATAVALLLVGVVVVATFVRDQRRDLDGALQRRAAAVQGDDTPAAFRDHAGPGTGPGTVAEGGRRWHTFTREGPDGETVRVVADLGPMRDEGRLLARRLFVVGLGALAVVGAGSWALSGLALRPLRRLQSTAGRVASTRDLDTRLPERDAPTEVAALAGSLNAMLGRLQRSADRTEAALEATRRFAADAGHELRTPLTSMRANLEVLRRIDEVPPDQRSQVLDDVLREQARLVALLDALQALARGDSSSIRREPLDLADVVDAAVVAAAARHPEVALGFDDPGAVPVTGWAEGLRLAVDNLLENAARHGGTRVVVTLARRDGGAVLTVDDDGPGIPPEDRRRVFERFARGRTGAPGSGLGLALVAQQAALHGGTVEIGEAPLGGARLVLTVA